jgi:fatty-acid desaturase
MTEFTPEELKNSKRIFKSATPKYTIDWYVKWFASVMVLSAMSVRGIEGLMYYDLALSYIGLIGWLLVSFMWKDRALICVNGVGLVLLTKNILVIWAGA